MFKREVNPDKARAGYCELLSKLNESNLNMRKIKNGQTIFESPVMQLKYANPFFKNDQMHGKLLNYLD